MNILNFMILSQRDVSAYELDEHGFYHLDDYQEAFGSLAEFFSITQEITKRMYNCPSLQIEKIKEDYKQLTESLGHKPHFDEIKESSKLGIEYYLNHSGTLKKFKEDMNIILKSSRDGYFVPSDSERAITKSKVHGFGQ